MGDAILLEKTSCPCGSSDGRGVYDDGHTYCYVCKAFTHGNPEKERRVSSSQGFMVTPGEALAIPLRGLSKAACKFFDYTTLEDGTQVAAYRDLKGALKGQKVRKDGKKFSVTGSISDCLFGMHLWKDGGKRLVITEGEIDAISYNIACPSWPVVSIPNGASGASKSIKACIEWIEKFEEVVFAFDNDEPGQKGAQSCASLLSPGKAKIAKLNPSFKDFNEALLKKDHDAIKTAVYNAATFRPDGILGADDLWEALLKRDTTETYQYPWQGLNRLTRGIRKGELVTLTAGTGIGKSALCREIAYSLSQGQRRKVGLMFLEENAKRTALSMIGLHLSRPVHLDPEFHIKEHEAAFDEVFGQNRLAVFDHFGSMDIDNLLSRIRYLAVGCGCDFVFLDHLSIVISGLGIENERQAVDVAMTKLRTLVEQTGIGLVVVSHLRRLHSDDAHETGTIPQLAHLRGSHGIAQLSDMVLAAARNQQAEGDDKNKTAIHVLKNRFSGETGYACTLGFDPITYRLNEAAPAKAAEAFPDDLTL